MLGIADSLRYKSNLMFWNDLTAKAILYGSENGHNTEYPGYTLPAFGDDRAVCRELCG